MNLINHTKMLAGFTMSTDKTGREHVVVVVKGTFGIPSRPDEEPKLLDEQVPLVTCDEFTGEPGFSSPLYEIDYSPHKPRCDVLLNGSAYAPGGKPTERVTVRLQVGSVNKSFDVVGNRTWKAGTLFQGASAIEPFVKQTISYDVAFGGVDRTSEDPAKHRWYLTNHAGRGYYVTSDPKAINGKPMPNTEETGRPVTTTSGNYNPMAFGPVGRSWQPRVKWAGTYDQKWLDGKNPFFPDDFDNRYFQKAPEDQQTEFLNGGEKVTLLNLTVNGQTTFCMPHDLQLNIRFAIKNQKEQNLTPVVDTVILEPNKGLFTLSWKCCLALRRNPFEVSEINVDWSVLEESKTREKRQRGKSQWPSLNVRG